RSVREVERLCAELEALSLDDLELLEQGEVQVEQPRPQQEVVAGVSEREGLGNCKSRGVEPALEGPLARRQRAVPKTVGALVEVEAAREVRCGREADRETAARRKDPVHLPATQHLAHDPAVLKPRLTDPEG